MITKQKLPNNPSTQVTRLIDQYLQGKLEQPAKQAKRAVLRLVYCHKRGVIKD